jgi:hypothetical protein
MKRDIFVRTVINWSYNYAPIGGPQQQTAATATAEAEEKKGEEEEREG